MYKRKYGARKTNGRYSKYGKFGSKKTFKKTFIQRNKMNALTKYSTHKAINPKIKTLDLDFGVAYPLNGLFVVDQLANSALPINSGQNSITPTFAPAIQNVLTIQQGASESMRIGNKICVKSIRIKLICVPTPNNNISSTHGRFLVIYDRQTNGTYPAPNTILSSLNQSGSTLPGTYMDSINPNYMERFVVLCDEFITFPAATSAGLNATEEVVSTNDKPLYIDKFIKCKNLEAQFNGNTIPLGIGSVTTGAIYFISWGDANPFGLTPNDPWMWTGNVRVRFHDC